ncbi:DUF6468 domain-containing protein, partial [Phenylobacterium sp.]|uniref:DUF6468 domain-containing protein n=1 Tax=Phenylobacterium sp. TaxID=1871053 RepID=UPI002E340C1E
MSAVAIGLNLLLAALLAAALAMGWRLNGRLKTLRESQAGFAKAVADLNAAAARAERGLAELRAGGDEAMELLSDRIKKGRELASKLETLTAAAQSAATRSPAARAPAAQAGGEDVLELSARDRRLGALLAEAQRRRAAPEPEPPARAERPL